MFRVVVGLIGWITLLGCLNNLIAAPAAPDKPKTPTPAERIHKELEQVSSFEIVDQPLSLAINQLRDLSKINFVIDAQTVAQMGIDPDQVKVQVRLKNAKLKTGLRAVLGTCNLNYVILNDIIFISSDDMTMHRQMQQRVSVDLDKIDFAQALKQLARETASNLIIDPRALKDANQPVSLQVEDVPLETAVRLMCEMGGLKPVRVGNVLFVTNRANALEMRNDPDLVPGRPGQPGVDPNAPNGVVVPGVQVQPGVVVAPPNPNLARVPLPANVPPAGPAEKAEKADTSAPDAPPKDKEKPKANPTEEPAKKPAVPER